MPFMEPAPSEILLVEDNPLDAEFTMRALKGGGITNNLRWVKDGQEALDYLLRHGEYARRDGGMPGLIFLDLKMPRVNGLEVLQAIKFDIRTKNIPVVVMTSSAEDQDVTRAYDLGANSYVVKPIELNAVLETVRKIGHYWLSTNRPAG
jgi:two-component system response regulator